MKHMVQKAGLLAARHGWDLSKPFKDLPKEAKDALLNGSDEVIPMIFSDRNGDWEYNGHYPGLLPWLEKRFAETESDSYREELLRYRAEDICQTCKGARLKPEVLAVTLGGYSIAQLTEMPIEELIKILDTMKLE